MDTAGSNDPLALRSTYEAVPRTLDPRLEALKRSLSPIPILPAILVVVSAMSVLGSAQWLLMYGVVTVGTVLPLALLIASGIWYRRTATARRAELEQDIRDAALVAAVVVEANPQLYTPGFHDLPARVVYTLDVARRLDVPYLESLAQGARSLKGATAPSPELAEIHQMVNDPNAYGARRFPPGLAGNEQTFLAVIAVKTRNLAENRITSPVIPCLFLARRAQLAPF